MNAIIALCHFCEGHGPTSIFCTQTIRDTKIDELSFNSAAIPTTSAASGDTAGASKQIACPACTSLGAAIGMLSQDPESNASFLSTQAPVLSDCITIVKQAAFRSLSCEISSKKDGGFVYFGDAVRGHVLSHTFQLRDAHARGFTKLYSIVVIMKDKMFLLNTQPFMAMHMKKVSQMLQDYTSNTYTSMQSQYSERARRLNSGEVNGIASRSLDNLTGQPNIFAYIHAHFTWLLWAGARYLTETITLGSPTVPPWIGHDTEEGFSVVQMDKEDWLLKKFENSRAHSSSSSASANDAATTKDTECDQCSLRMCKNMLNSHFIAACYCAIVGIQVTINNAILNGFQKCILPFFFFFFKIVIRGSQKQTIAMLKCFQKLLPDAIIHKYARTECRTKYMPQQESRILCLLSDISIPHQSNGIFRVDFIDNDQDIVTVKWSGELPTKCMTK